MKKLLGFILIWLMACSLFACDNNRADKMNQDSSGANFTILGKWTEINNGNTYVFNEDGTGSYWHEPAGLIEEKFLYEFEGDSLKIRYFDEDIPDLTFEVEASTSRGFLELRFVCDLSEENIIIVRPENVGQLWDMLSLNGKWVLDEDNCVEYFDDGTVSVRLDGDELKGKYKFRVTVVDPEGVREKYAYAAVDCAFDHPFYDDFFFLVKWDGNDYYLEDLICRKWHKA